MNAFNKTLVLKTKSALIMARIGSIYILFSQRINQGSDQITVIWSKARDIDSFFLFQTKQVIGAYMKNRRKFNNYFRGRKPIAQFVKRNDCMLYAYPSIWEGLKVFLTEEFTDVIAWKEITPPSVCLTETEGEEDWVVPDKEPL